jgi:hypothetical protein
MNSLDYYKIEELLTEEERAIGDWAAQFVQEEVLRIAPCHRAGKFPEHLFHRQHMRRVSAHAIRLFSERDAAGAGTPCGPGLNLDDYFAAAA